MTTKTSPPKSNNNTNSLFSKYSRYVAGGVTERANDMLEWWERANFPRDPTDIVYAVENAYVNRLDLISVVFYGEARWWWVIAMYNNILDPYVEVTAGTVLLIPSQDRLSFLLNTARGGVESTREAVTTISPIIA